MKPDDAQIRSALLRAGRRLKLSAILVNASWWLAVCLGWWLLVFLLDNLLSLPAGIRLPLALGGAALVGMGFVKKVYAILRIRPRPERTAVMLEQRYGIGDNVLINAAQFEQRPLRPEEQAFARRTVDEGAGWISRLSFAELWDSKPLTLWGSAAVVLLIIWAGYILIFPRHVWNAGSRFIVPLADKPPVASVTLKLKPDADVAVVEGDNLQVIVEAGGKLKDVPVLVWKEGAASVEPVESKSSGEHLPMAVAQSSADQATEAQSDTHSASHGSSKFTYLFSDVRHPFAFRVFADGAYSRSVQVTVKSLPRLKESVFRVTPPSYTGSGAITNPGPPSSVAGLAGSKLDVLLSVEPAVEQVLWKDSGRSVGFRRSGWLWECSTTLTNAGEYEVQITDAGFKREVTVARGAVRLDSDNPPEIDFVTDDRNRLVSIGATVRLELQARDDFGILDIAITARSVESDPAQAGAAAVLKRWTYLGPPGNKGPLKETYALEIDPARFKPDAAYLVEAVARDFNPAGQPGRSRPIMIRVQGLDEFALSGKDALAPAFAALRQTIAKQEKANSLTANLTTYLEEALQKKTIPDRRRSMTSQQQDAQSSGKQALAEFNKVKDGQLYAVRLSPLVEGEMGWVLRDIGRLDGSGATTAPSSDPAIGKRRQRRQERASEPAAPTTVSFDFKTLSGQLASIEQRQSYILTELIALLGNIADREKQSLKPNALAKDLGTPPMTSAQDFAKDLQDDLKKFMTAEERILERTKTLLDKDPQDLTEKDEEILGDLAREEAKWAKFFEEKLTDLSKLPQQDFADASLAKELNSVFQEIKEASKELYEKKTELAVPAEQSGLENAKELVQNLERWLPDTPDHTKWNMEEPTTPADVAMAELPAELEDIVGDLLDKEEEMGKDVEDVTSPWMDSIDKGAGWGASDGPISSMSAKGVTGNQLPNNMEIGGRSGEGRSGRSSGQMVSDTAEGKGGRETPTRLSQTPFEQGSVKDSFKGDPGGATGGGKLSGAGQEGLRGPTPSQETAAKMPRLAEKQAKIRQEAEALALKLRGYHLPSGDLEQSINDMKHVEQAAQKLDGVTLHRSYSRAVDALGDARKAVRAEVGLHQERTKLPEWMRAEVRTGLQDGMPKGYEEMIGEYFKALAEKKRQ